MLRHRDADVVASDVVRTDANILRLYRSDVLRTHAENLGVD